MSMISIIILTAIIIFSLATLWYSSGEAAFFFTLIVFALLFFWDLGNGGQLMISNIISIGGWLSIRLWTALMIYLTLLGGYVFGNLGKAIVILVILLIVLYHLGVLGPLTHGDIGAIKEAIQIGG